MSKTAFAIGEVVAIGQRITRLEGEITNLNADKAEIYREARGNGFDVKALKKAIKKWQRLQDDPQAEQEAAALEDLYLAALTGQDGAETAQDRISVAANGLPKSSTRARTSDTHKTPANGGGLAAAQEHPLSKSAAAQTNLDTQPAESFPPVVSKQEASAGVEAENSAPAPIAEAVNETPATLAGGEAPQNSPPDRYAEAVKLVRESGKPSMAMLQMTMEIGYMEAATYIDRMVAHGIISAPQANGKRDILDTGDIGEIPAFLRREKTKATHSATELLASG